MATRVAPSVRWLADGAVVQAVIAGALSFAHLHDLAAAHGQAGWKAWTYPLSVDLLTVAAYRRLRTRGGLLAWVWFLLAVSASLAANIAQAGPGAVGVLVGAWPAVAFLGCTLLGPATAAEPPVPAGGGPVRLARDSSDPDPLPELDPAPAPPPVVGPPEGVSSPVWAYALKLATAHREEHGGDITAAVLRSRLGVSSAVAETLHSHLTRPAPRP